MLYLDNAATTLKKPPCVYASMMYNTLFNSVNSGHGGHFYSLRGAKKIYETAEALAQLFNIPNPEQIAFTANATYALNMGIRGLVGKDDHVVTTVMEHNSVLRTLNGLCRYSMAEASADGSVSAGQIERLIRPETRLIVVNHASNVCGTVQNIKEIGKVAAKHNIPFMVDAAQSAGNTEIDVVGLGIDMLALSAHKGLMGPLGVGILYVSDKLSLSPVITGGTGSDSKNLVQPSVMPDLLESGTLNTPAIIACQAAAKYVMRRGVDSLGHHERRLALELIERLGNMRGVRIYGKTDGGGRNGTVAFNIRGFDSTELAEELCDDYKICVRGGWHCAYPAHLALKTGGTGAVRVSFGAYDTRHSLNRICDAIYKISKKRQ